VRSGLSVYTIFGEENGKSTQAEAAGVGEDAQRGAHLYFCSSQDSVRVEQRFN